MFDSLVIFHAEISEFFIGYFWFALLVTLVYFLLVDFLVKFFIKKGRSVFFFPLLCNVVLFVLGLIVLLLIIFGGGPGEGVGMFVMFVPPFYLGLLFVNFLITLGVSALSKKLLVHNIHAFYLTFGIIAIFVSIAGVYLFFYRSSAPYDFEKWAKIAVQKNDPEICLKVYEDFFDDESNMESRAKCWKIAGELSGKNIFCDKIIGQKYESYQSECLTNVGIMNGELSECTKISNSYSQKRCQSAVAGVRIIKEKLCPDLDYRSCFLEKCRGSISYGISAEAVERCVILNK
jgi:hypothetical protein